MDSFGGSRTGELVPCMGAVTRGFLYMQDWTEFMLMSLLGSREKSLFVFVGCEKLLLSIELTWRILLSIHPAVLCGYDLTAIIVSLFTAPLNIFRLLYGENRDEYIHGYQTYVDGDKYNDCVQHSTRSTVLNTSKPPCQLRACWSWFVLHGGPRKRW